MATVQSILTLHERGWSGRRIADELHADGGTVSRYVDPQDRQAIAPPKRKRKPGQNVTWERALTHPCEAAADADIVSPV